MAKILIVDDKKNILRSLETYLQLLGYTLLTAPSLTAGKALYLQEKPDVSILDIFRRGENGTDLLTAIRKQQPQAIVIMISGHADLKTAVEAIKLGAYDFMEKPMDTDKLRIVIENGLQQQGLQNQRAVLKDRWLADNFIVGRTPRMQEVLAVAEKVGPTGLAVLIQGESGTGKELLAYYIYLNSGHTEAPFVAVNCAAIQPELFESALFGHKKGSFTGAVADHPGYFLAACPGYRAGSHAVSLRAGLQGECAGAAEPDHPGQFNRNGRISQPG